MISISRSAYNLSNKSAAFIEAICSILYKYKSKNGIKQYTVASHFGAHFIDNGYFMLIYNVFNGSCVLSVQDQHKNIPLENYMLSRNGSYSEMITNLEELESFCETAKFIGGFGDE